ncbi:hypothetical protein PoB_003264400 [Plakobranchus ocellatus]|uniref:Uncharacterized protein n=1 Tax=Plakobranchus ocellatus TaxID=259542 RepID=A0AAV4AEQ9_9GAST|nr:hypothetical protein PoB_003264400 [Plakobranchus ocellatus]
MVKPTLIPGLFPSSRTILTNTGLVWSAEKNLPTRNREVQPIRQIKVKPSKVDLGESNVCPRYECASLTEEPKMLNSSQPDFVIGSRVEKKLKVYRLLQKIKGYAGQRTVT